MLIDEQEGITQNRRSVLLFSKSVDSKGLEIIKKTLDHHVSH